MFKRDFNSQTIESLKLFSEKLKPDILKGVVFSAIRGGYIDFYYKGGRLFTFQKEFVRRQLLFPSDDSYFYPLVVSLS